MIGLLGLAGLQEKDGGERGLARRRTYSANDVVVVSQMSFALLAAKDLVGVQVDVVCEPHYACL